MEKRITKIEKNPKPELIREQKNKNTAVSKERIFVEHTIGRMKRYGVLENRCRIKCSVTKNRILGIAAGLWNYQLQLNN